MHYMKEPTKWLNTAQTLMQNAQERKCTYLEDVCVVQVTTTHLFSHSMLKFVPILVCEHGLRLTEGDTIWTWRGDFLASMQTWPSQGMVMHLCPSGKLRLHISAFEDNPQLNVNTLHWRHYKDCQKDCQTWAHLHVTCSLNSSAGVNFPDWVRYWLLVWIIIVRFVCLNVKQVHV
jgi:hypothetical protein